MDKDSNLYIILYAGILTVAVAVILAFVSQSLKERQLENEVLAKKTDILQSVGMDTVRDISGFFAENIEGLSLNYRGDIIDTVDAMDIDLQSQYRIADEIRRVFPLFLYEDPEGRLRYIVPLSGMGLWDVIWGYLALDEDLETIVGASFDHAKETPGLGAEIAGRSFQESFVGKRIFDGDHLVGVEVKKGTLDRLDHQVQAIAGSTITTDGVTEMIKRGLSSYLPYFERLKEEN